MNEPDEWIARYFDDELSEAEAERLRAWLKASPENMRRFLREAHLQSQLPIAARGCAFTDLVLTVPLPERASSQPPIQAPASKRLRWVLPLAACAVALATVTALLSIRPTVRLEGVHGTVTVQRDKESIIGTEAMALHERDVVQTGKGARVRLQWQRETTRIDLQANTQARLIAVKGDKHLALLSGTLTAEVAKQSKDHPMILETKEGRVDVLGTRFELSAAGDKTRVEVASGRVLFSGAAQGSGAVVEACQAGEVTADGEVQVDSLPVAETVSMGLLAHWPLLEGQGSIARDASGHGRDATIQNPTWTTNENHIALDFTDLPGRGGLPQEKRSYLRTPDLHLPPAFTITLRLQTKQTDTAGHGVQMVFANGPYVEKASGFQFFINRPSPVSQRKPVSTDDQSFNFRVDDGLRSSAVRSLPKACEPGQWYFLTIRVNQPAGRVEVLVNGREVCVQPRILKEFSLDGPLYFGAPPGSITQPAAALSGMIRDVRLYSRALSEEEIQHLSNQNP